MYLYPSGSTLNLVSQQIFLPLINRLYSDHLGFLYTQTTQSSFASSRSNFLFGYSNLLAHLNLCACFCCCAFFAAIHLLFVLEAMV